MSGMIQTCIQATSTILGDKYLRVEDYIKSASFMIDDMSEENINKLEEEGKELYQKHKHQVKTLLEERLKQLAKEKTSISP